MSKIIAHRTIENKEEKGGEDFVIADLVLLMKSHLTVGEQVYIPVNIRNDEVTFWESGGRNEEFVSSIGTTISSSNDNIMDAILFNKLSRSPNGKQALMVLKRDYRLYVGKVSIRTQALAPRIKAVRLIYNGIDSELTDDKTTYGKFTVDEIFTTCGDIEGCIPGERLIKKLFTKNTIKPYFANGWSASDIISITATNPNLMTDAYMRLMSDDTEPVIFNNGDKFIDTVENCIVEMKNEKLSAAFQWIDFNSNMMCVKPLSNISLAHIRDDIGACTVVGNYKIELTDMMDAHNKRLIFDSSDLATLKLALQHDEHYSIEISDGVFCMLRGFRG